MTLIAQRTHRTSGDAQPGQSSGRAAYVTRAAKALKTLVYGLPALYARARRLPPAAVLVVAYPS